ncbi:MAG: family NAD(P)-dependent oxidoreductase [Akkermansiaceae bacterium]|nr:family NAD(P)-dependent oxidoreductase [Akkermansiaceae bacterium]
MVKVLAMKATFPDHWSTADIPSQAGKLAIVTGTGGLGYETALALANAGAEVIIAGRSEEKGHEAVARIRAGNAAARVRFGLLDLADLSSVAAFAELQLGEARPIDLLVNNAGVMTPPDRRETKDGFELQFGTNYLGHFALTARLLPLLLRGQETRVVQVSSGAHRLQADIHFDDLQWQRSYKPWPAYAQSKLATLMFALELQRRSDANGWGLMSNAAHPGYATTDLIANGPGQKGLAWLFNRYVMQPVASHSPASGALPTLLAATSPLAEKAGYYGPRNAFELKGPPAPAIVGKKAQDITVAKKLWDVSNELCGVAWS